MHEALGATKVPLSIISKDLGKTSVQKRRYSRHDSFTKQNDKESLDQIKQTIASTIDKHLDEILNPVSSLNFIESANPNPSE